MKNTAAVSLSGWRREASNERHLALLFSIVLANIGTNEMHYQITYKFALSNSALNY
jgi:hypothetical protein